MKYAEKTKNEVIQSTTYFCSAHSEYCIFDNIADKLWGIDLRQCNLIFNFILRHWHHIIFVFSQMYTLTPVSVALFVKPFFVLRNSSTGVWVIVITFKHLFWHFPDRKCFINQIPSYRTIEYEHENCCIKRKELQGDRQSFTVEYYFESDSEWDFR